MPRRVAWARETRRIRRGLQRRARPVIRALSARFASSLTRRIVFLNLGGLVALAVGFLYVNQFREGLIDARVQSLETQGEIIAAAISASASVSTDAIQIDPEKLLQLSPGQTSGPLDENSPSLQFSINPERIGPVLRRLVLPTRTRARIFDRDGYLLIDSRSLNHRTSVFRSNLPAGTSASEDGLTLIERTWNAVKGRFGRATPPRADEFTGRNGKNFPEVDGALGGTMQNVVRVNARGDTIISVAVPIRSLRSVKGALLLSTHRVVRVYGLVNVVALTIVQIVKSYAFASTWCFYAAIMSVMIYWQFRRQGIDIAAPNSRPQRFVWPRLPRRVTD